MAKSKCSHSKRKEQEDSKRKLEKNQDSNKQDNQQCTGPGVLCPASGIHGSTSWIWVGLCSPAPVLLPPVMHKVPLFRPAPFLACLLAQHMFHFAGLSNILIASITQASLSKAHTLSWQYLCLSKGSPTLPYTPWLPRHSSQIWEQAPTIPKLLYSSYLSIQHHVDTIGFHSEFFGPWMQKLMSTWVG